MPVVTYHDVPYHQQNTPTYCGPATALMILASIDGTIVQEENLWPFVHPVAGDWSASPDGLAFGLNHWAPPNFDGFFSVNRARTEHDGSLELVKTLCAKDSAPAAALVFGDGHWIAVCGVNLDEDPAAGGEPAILGFYINSPSVTPLNPPAAHSSGDSCGTTADYGSANEMQYVSYEAWRSDFFTGYTEGGVPQFVTVCSDAKVELESVSRQAGRIRGGIGFALPAAVGGGHVDPDVARAQALAAIAAHQLDKRGPLQNALTEITAGTPQLVRRIDVVDWYYYLIPLFRGDVGVGVARMDADYGTFMGVSALRNGQFHLRSIEQVAATLGYRYAVAPELFWKPCRESTSPYYPFHAVSGPAAFAFLDYAGSPYPKLTPLGRGD